jgi:MFS family permease
MTRSGGVTTQLHRRLCAAALLGSASYAICRVPLLPLLARDLGATPSMVGVIVGASTVTGILVKLPAGAWSDVFGRQALLIAAGLVFALLPLAYLGVASLGMLAALRFVHGSATAIFGPVSAASLSDVAPVHRRATWLSTLSTLQGLGQAAAPIIAGLLMARAGYDAAFVVAALLGMAVPLLLWRWPRHTAAPGVDSRRSVRDAVRAVLRDRPIVLTSLTQAALRAATGAVAAFVPLYASDVMGLSAFAIGVVFALQAAAGLVARPVAGWLSDRAGREPLMITGLVACAVASASLPLASHPAALAGLLAAMSMGAAMTTISATAFITDRSRRASYGAAHGVFGTVYDVGDALGPIAGGVLVSTAGYSGLFEAAALVTIGAAVALSLRRARLDVGELGAGGR